MCFLGSAGGFFGLRTENTCYRRRFHPTIVSVRTVDTDFELWSARITTGLTAIQRVNQAIWLRQVFSTAAFSLWMASGGLRLFGRGSGRLDK